MAKLPFLINDGKWHHICVTWTTRDGVWEAFQDGVKRGSGENLAPYHPIKPQGLLILGQEQVNAAKKKNYQLHVLFRIRKATYERVKKKRERNELRRIFHCGSFQLFQVADGVILAVISSV